MGFFLYPSYLTPPFSNNFSTLSFSAGERQQDDSRYSVTSTSCSSHLSWNEQECNLSDVFSFELIHPTQVVFIFILPHPLYLFLKLYSYLPYFICFARAISLKKLYSSLLIEITPVSI